MPTTMESLDVDDVSAQRHEIENLRAPLHFHGRNNNAMSGARLSTARKFRRTASSNDKAGHTEQHTSRNRTREK